MLKGMTLNNYEKNTIWNIKMYLDVHRKKKLEMYVIG